MKDCNLRSNAGITSSLIHITKHSSNMDMSSLAFTQELAQQLFDSADEYPVNFDEARQWLGYTTKRGAKESFMSFGFKEGRDFYREICQTPQGGRPSELLYITVDALKLWGMMTRTPQGDQIRQYFLECERIAKDKMANMSIEEIMLQNLQTIIDTKKRVAAFEKEQRLLEARQKALEEKQQFEHDSLKADQNAQKDDIEDLKLELSRYSNGHGSWYSIVAWWNILNREISLKEASNLGRKASSLCRKLGITPEPIKDPRFGKVNLYPESILKHIS